MDATSAQPELHLLRWARHTDACMDAMAKEWATRRPKSVTDCRCICGLDDALGLVPAYRRGGEEVDRG